MDTGQPLVGQVAVVTGAGRGIGAAIALKLAKLGATTVLCGRTQSTLDSTAKAILEAGGKAEVIPCDVTILHQMEYASARVDSTFGRLDILVNNAGVGGFNGSPSHPCTRGLGSHPQHQPARRLFRDQSLRALNDSRLLRTHHQHFISGRKECAAQRRGLRRLQVGTQRPDLLGRRRASRSTISARP